jgi:hypothetical protein
MMVQASEMKATMFCAVFSQHKAMRMKRLIAPIPARCGLGPYRGFRKELRLGRSVLAVRNGRAVAVPAGRSV